MATVDEQIFLYGEVDAEPMAGPLAVLEYADLTLSGSLIFALMIFIAVIAGYWELLAPLLVACLKKSFFLISSMASRFKWLVSHLLSIRSSSDLHTILSKAKAKLGMAIARSRPASFMTAIADWYCPRGQPEKIFWRLPLTGAFGMLARSSYTDLSSALNDLQYDQYGFSTWFEEYTAPGDVHHSYAIAIVAVCILCVALTFYPFQFFSDDRAFREVTYQSTETQMEVDDSKEAELRAMADTYEAKLHTIIKNRESTQRALETQLATKSRELVAANKEKQQDRKILDDAYERVFNLRCKKLLLDEENSSLRNKLNQTQIDCTKYQAWYKQERKDKEDLAQENAGLKQRIEWLILGEDTPEYYSELADFEKQLKQMKEAQGSEEAQHIGAAQHSEAKDAEIAKLNKEKTELERTVESLRKKNVNLESSKPAESKVRQLKAKIASLNKELEIKAVAEREAMMNLAKTNSGLQKRLEEAKQAPQIAQIPNAKVQIQNYKDDIKGLRKRLREAYEERTLKERMNRDLETERNKLESRMSELIEAYENVKAKMAKLKSQKTKLKSNLKTQKVQMEQATAGLTERNANLEAQVKKATSASAERDREIEELKRLDERRTAEYNKLSELLNRTWDSDKRQATQYRGKLEVAEQQNHTLAEQLEQLGNQKQQLEQTTRNHKEVIDQLQKTNTELKNEILQANEGVEALRSGIQEQAQAYVARELEPVHEMVNSYNSLQTDLQSLQQQKTELANRSENLQMQVEMLIEENQRLTKDLNDRDTASEMERELLKEELNKEKEDLEAKHRQEIQALTMQVQKNHGQMTGGGGPFALSEIAAQNKVREAQEEAERFRNAMKEQKDACNQILEAMDNEYKVCAGKLDEEIRKLERENQGFRQRLESAQHHASQSEHKANQERKKIEEATRVISTLEHRLSKFEAPAGQEIQKRTVTNRGSVMSELEDARVKLVQKEGEIRRLTERLDQLRRDPTTNGPRPDESPESWASRKVSECMDALKKEKKKKRDDERHQFERDKATHFSEIKRLKEQAEKLRIENSRLQAACPGRPKGSIFMQKPRN